MAALLRITSCLTSSLGNKTLQSYCACLLNTHTAVWDKKWGCCGHKKKLKPIYFPPKHSRLLDLSAGRSRLILTIWENQDNSVKLSNSLVSKSNMAASIQYVTLPEPALSDLRPAVLLFTTFGSDLDRQSSSYQKDQQIMLLHWHK